ncbi:prephenate dehydrogenase [Spiribacter vilamensis]|uniref:prephenate dehydrogenase n=1 Tax=Spiribacter vilamensis TaxID=531306 RepID=UPI00102B9D7E|nr:prephenate dehydrogenase/arogenate dehydrogenase family protein [Spiribacter vilamensis]TVO62161.1 prephenate dehydrogenase/arogenate dehydrogenase family protein [Spiribacter vilamensis]
MRLNTRPRRICLVGVGLIAGSLGLALKRAEAVETITGLGRGLDRLARAQALGAIDRYTTDPGEAIEDADLVVLGVPLGATAGVMRDLRPHLHDDLVITDVGSAKRCVVDDVETALGAAPPGFVPGHPIAGTEHSGVEAAFPSLFDGRRVILTPLASGRVEATEAVEWLWRQAGAEVTTMSVAHHDRMLAITSHLPHLLAFGLVDMLARDPDHEEILGYAAGGFRDFTRIASSDPVMWRDICLGNREAVLEALSLYRRDLEQLAEKVEASDGTGLEAVFRSAKQTRDAHKHGFER